VPDPHQPAVTLGTLDQLQLHIGDRLQLELSSGATPSQYFTLLIGYVPGHSVLVRTPVVQNLPVPVREGEAALVRTFSGRHASTFETTVLRVTRSPFPYLHLAYPQSVKQALIRGALRVRVSLPATFVAAGSDDPVAVSISDLSVSGALLESRAVLGEAGDKGELAFKFVVQPNNYEVKLPVKVEIQSVKAKRATGTDAGFVHGVQFGRLHTTETLLLQSYVQQVLLQDRSRVV
jgi:hypothetical protein